MWSLFGLKTPFSTATFDEAIIVVDVMMWVGREFVLALLAEAARISRTVLLCWGPLTEQSEYSFLVDTFREVLASLCLASLEIVRF